MNYSSPSKCSVCGNRLNITRLTCSNCLSEISGSFAPCKFCSLNDKLKLFLETFLKCKGNIKDVERSLSISYPTVKGLLDELLYELFQSEKSDKQEETPKQTPSQILDMLEKKQISANEAAKLLSDL